MPTNKETFTAQMNALADSINTKAGTSGKKTISQMKTAVDSISTGITPTGTIPITENGIVDVTNYASADVNVSGGELNIHYGLTPPEDTSKLWVKRATEPDFVEVSPDSRFNFGTMTETLGVGTADFTNLFFVDNLYLYSYYNAYVKKYDKETFELINSYYVGDLCSNICIVDNIMYYLKGAQAVWTYTAIFYARNLDTNVETQLYYYIPQRNGRLLYYDNRIYIVGGYSYTAGGSGAYYTYTNSTSTYVYDIVSGTGRRFSSPSLMGDVSICLIDSTVYVFGGCIPEHTERISGVNQTVPAQYSNHIYAIDLLTETYTAKTDMNNATCNVGVANIGKYIYIAGGYATPTSLFVFDTIENTITNTNIQLTGSRTSCGCYFIGTNLILSSISTRVDKITVEVELQENVLRIFVETSNNLFNIINWQNATVRIGVSGVFVGNSNDLAESVHWAIHDGTNWVNDDGTIDYKKPYPCAISVSGTVLTVTDDPRNAGHIEDYLLYVNSFIAGGSFVNTSIDIANYLSTGNNTITVKVRALDTTSGEFVLSEASNAVELSAYSITNVLTNVSAAAGNATVMLSTQSSVALTYTADSGYALPQGLTSAELNVVGCDFTWNQSTGVLTLSNPTGNITVTIVGEVAASGYNVTVRDGGVYSCKIKINGVEYTQGVDFNFDHTFTNVRSFNVSTTQAASWVYDATGSIPNKTWGWGWAWDTDITISEDSSCWVSEDN